MTKSKKPTSIRVFGQRSISSIFRSLPPNSSRDSEAIVTNQASGKSDESTHVSPSHFPDGKLQQSSLPPQTVPGKLTPFQCLRIPSGEQAGNVKQFEEEKNGAMLDDKVIIEMFKHTKEEEKSDFVIPIDVDELEESVAADVQESRKGKTPFEGGNENQTVRSNVVVLGGESSLKLKRRMENDSCIKKPRPCDSEAIVRNQASQNNESTRVLLSRFLDRKVPKSSLPPQMVSAGNVKQVEEEKNGAPVYDKLIIEMFKRTKDEGQSDFVIPPGVDELENSVANDIQELRKRKIPYEGGNENQTVRNHVVVLGGGSSLKTKRQMENDSGNKKPRPLYNHYKNGRGWWDHDMEGVDNEQLGSSEAWEGVGSTTLGDSPVTDAVASPESVEE